MYEDAERDGMDGDELRTLWDYIWDYGVDDDANQAMEMLGQGRAFRVDAQQLVAENGVVKDFAQAGDSRIIEDKF